MQICAKVGGEPWAIDKLPFVNIPTMVIGIDVYNKSSKTIISCVGSYNDRFTKYLSVVKYEDQGKDITAKVKEGIVELAEAVNLF